MPKLKSHSGAKKRFRKTATGRWKHKRTGLMHILTPSSGKHGRFKRKANYLNSVQGEIVRKYLPYS